MKMKNRVIELTHDDSRILHRKVMLRPKRLTDALNDYNWERDPELAYLDAVPPLTTTFAKYLLQCAEQLSFPSPTRKRFAIETHDGKHIGNCSYYNIDQAEGETELGIMIGNRGYWDKGYGGDAIAALVCRVFQNTYITRIYLKTLDSNSRAQKCFQKCGFVPYSHMTSNGFSFTLMEIYHDRWQKYQTPILSVSPV
ncbi:GNAT family N-acetyltransferase [Chloroflexota bacterium]